MATLTKAQTYPTLGKKFEHVGQGVEASYTLSAASGNGDTFDVGFMAEHVVIENKAGVSYSIANNQPIVGRSRITLTAGVAAADVLRVTVKGRP